MSLNTAASISYLAISSAAHKRSRKRTRGYSMNAGRAFDRDMLRRSTGDPLIDNIGFGMKGG
jgi:hypothetical protein